MIAPKPTSYNGIQFRSVLEARWAICLDHFEGCELWTHEPDTFVDPGTGWKYTPDFFCDCWGYLEIKPKKPNANYILNRKKFLPLFHPFPLWIAYGSFYYKKPLPRFIHVKSGNELTFTKICNDRRAANMARSWRFDL